MKKIDINLEDFDIDVNGNPMKYVRYHYSEF
jgi:hypothetical protein